MILGGIKFSRYLLANVTGTSLSSKDFAERLLQVDRLGGCCGVWFDGFVSIRCGWLFCVRELRLFGRVNPSNNCQMFWKVSQKYEVAFGQMLMFL